MVMLESCRRWTQYAILCSIEFFRIEWCDVQALKLMILIPHDTQLLMTLQQPWNAVV